MKNLVSQRKFKILLWARKGEKIDEKGRFEREKEEQESLARKKQKPVVRKRLQEVSD